MPEPSVEIVEENLDEPNSSSSRDLLSRREFLAVSAKTIAGITLANLTRHNLPSIVNAIGLMPPHGRELVPKETSDLYLPEETSNTIFQELDPSRFSPDVLNEEVFDEYAQRLANMSTVYFNGNPNPDSHEFQAHLSRFVHEIDDVSGELGIGLPQVLMGFMTSARNIGSSESKNDDVGEEAKIEIINKAGTFLESHDIADKDSFIVELWRRSRILGLVNESQLKTLDIPRIQNPRTFGIHDMESIEIGRALLHSARRNPNFAGRISNYGLNEDIENAIEGHNCLIDVQTYFEDGIVGLEEKYSGSEDIAFISEIRERDFLRPMISQDGRISPFQYTRTTHAWATMLENESSELDTALGDDNSETIEMTLDLYTDSEDGLQRFLLSQITNPQFRIVLQEKSTAGGKLAEDLLKFSDALLQLEDYTKRADRILDSKFIALENDMEFQVASGVAYIKYIYDRYFEGESEYFQDSVSLDNLAYSHLYYGASREIAPPMLLADRAGVTTADLPYLDPEIIDLILFKIEEGYRSSSGMEPVQNIEQYLSYLNGKLQRGGYVIRVGDAPGAKRVTEDYQRFLNSNGFRSGMDDLFAIYRLGAVG